jgi:uncharacterized protein
VVVLPGASAGRSGADAGRGRSGGDDALPRRLDDDECRRLLGTRRLGRLGYTVDALPAIVPAAFALLDGQVVIPADARSPVPTAVRGSVVAFEVDSYRPESATGWCVTVVGPARLVVDPAESGRLDALDLFPAASPAGRRYISVRIGLVHGWRSAGAGEHRPDEVR